MAYSVSAEYRLPYGNGMEVRATNFHEIIDHVVADGALILKRYGGGEYIISLRNPTLMYVKTDKKN